MVINYQTFENFVEIFKAKTLPFFYAKKVKIVQNLDKSPLCILKRYCLVAIMDLLWQLLFGRSHNFRSYGLIWDKKENYFSSLKYIFVKVAIYETNPMDNE